MNCATERDLEAAQAVAAEVRRLRDDREALLTLAARHGLLVPDNMRERLSLGARGLPRTRRAARRAGEDGPARRAEVSTAVDTYSFYGVALTSG